MKGLSKRVWESERVWGWSHALGCSSIVSSITMTQLVTHTHTHNDQVDERLKDQLKDWKSDSRRSFLVKLHLSLSSPFLSHTRLPTSRTYTHAPHCRWHISPHNDNLKGKKTLLSPFLLSVSGPHKARALRWSSEKVQPNIVIISIILQYWNKNVLSSLNSYFPPRWNFFSQHKKLNMCRCRYCFARAATKSCFSSHSNNL